MLNVLAALSAHKSLQESDQIVDIAWGGESFREDGVVATLTQNSKPWCMRAGRFLTAAQKSALMGFKLEELDLRGMTEAWWHRKLGLGMHVAAIGSMALALVAGPVATRLRAPSRT